MTTRSLKLARAPRAEQWAHKINTASARSVESILEIGRLLHAAKRDLAHGEFGRLFDERLIPFSQNTADRLMAIAGNPVLSNSAHVQNLPPSWGTLYELTKIPGPVLRNAIKDGIITPDIPRKAIAGLLPAGARLESESKPHVAGHTGDNEWYTPAEIVNAARALMGGIDLDPASSELANTVINARKYFTREASGLTRDWFGRVWLNPPYGQPLVADFCEKLVQEVHNGHLEAAVVLVNNATETVWFQMVADVAAGICFPRGRILFWQPGKPDAPPLQGQAIVYLGPDFLAFRRAFQHLGIVVPVYLEADNCDAHTGQPRNAPPPGPRQTIDPV